MSSLFIGRVYTVGQALPRDDHVIMSHFSLQYEYSQARQQMTYPMYLSCCYGVTPPSTSSIWLPWSNPPDIIAIYSKVLPYTTHAFVTPLFTVNCVAKGIKVSFSQPRQCCQMTSESKGHFKSEPPIPILILSMNFIICALIESCFKYYKL